MVGHPVERLANTSCLHFPGLPAATALVLLDDAGICCTTGSACTSHSPEPSRGLLALGLSPAEALETLRFSLSAETTPEEISAAIPVILRVLEKIRVNRGGSGGVVVRR
jgi:cysteine desulfurase